VIIHRQGTSRRKHKAAGKQDVADTVNSEKTVYRRGDNRSRRGGRCLIWEEAEQIFPMPSGVKPLTKGHVLWSEQDQMGLALDLLSNTWRNPANAHFKGRKLYVNILPRISSSQIYQRRVPIDDWNEKVHGRIARAIQRAKGEGQGWLWVDNGLKRGYVIYLSDIPGLKGFEPVEDLKSVLIGALNSIAPPARDEDEGRFRPYGGSQNWVGRADDTGEEDQNRWEVIAVAQGPTDFICLEAECVGSGIATRFTPPYWRAQPFEGLAMCFSSKEELIAFAKELPEYILTKGAVVDQPSEMA
jgi:hypothetical protein